MLEKAPNQLLQAIKLKVPAGIECDHCVLQWAYVTSNSPWSYPEACIQPALPPQPARLPAAPTPTALEPAATVATGLLELRRHRNHAGGRDARTLALAFTLSIALSGILSIAVAISVTISESSYGRSLRGSPGTAGGRVPVSCLPVLHLRPGLPGAHATRKRSAPSSRALQPARIGARSAGFLRRAVAPAMWAPAAMRTPTAMEAPTSSPKNLCAMHEATATAVRALL